jgi:hypothetical protein
LFFAGVISAQTLMIGPQVGFSKSGDADKASVMPAVAARLSLLNLEAELSIGYKSEEFDDGSIKTKSYPVLFTGMFKIFPVFRAEAGIGWYNTKIEYDKSDETVQKIGYHVGGGAEIPLGNIVLTGDFRYVFLDVALNNDLKSDYYTMNVGLLFKL